MNGDEDSIVQLPEPTQEEIATHLGFSTVEEYHEWEEAGCPVGKCSNWLCGRPAFWPDLHGRCKHCGFPVLVEYMTKSHDLETA